MKWYIFKTHGEAASCCKLADLESKSFCRTNNFEAASAIITGIYGRRGFEDLELLAYDSEKNVATYSSFAVNL